VLEALQPEDVLRRLDADPHLVAVVGARVREAVHGGSDEASQDAVSLSDLERTVAVGFEAVDADEDHSGSGSSFSVPFGETGQQAAATPEKSRPLSPVIRRSCRCSIQQVPP
jgi:hypothetical protein